MTVRQILPLCLTAVIAFTLGRILPRGSGITASEESPRSDALASNGDGRTPENAGDVSTASVRHRERPVAKNKDSSEDMIKVPKSAVKSVLDKKHFMFMNMHSAPMTIDSALALLGTSENQRQQVTKLLEETKANLLQEEIKHFKVTSTDSSQVLIDMGGISDAATKVINGTEARFREILSAEQADALLENVEWRYYYPQIDPRSSQAKFVIERESDGHLMAAFRYGGGAQRIGVDSGTYPDNGTPIPAWKVFDNRWRPLLEGIELLPVDSPK